MRRPLSWLSRLCAWNFVFRRETRISLRRNPLLAVVAVLGIGAFVLSALSPVDDDLQRDCLHGRTTARTVTRLTRNRLISVRAHPLSQGLVQQQAVERSPRVEQIGPLDLLLVETPLFHLSTSRAPPVLG